MVIEVPRTFDWVRRFDPKSLNYLVRDLNPDLPMRTHAWKRSLWLDQGREGACTGFAISHNLGTTPRKMGGIDNPFAQHRYYRAREEDEWPGENYEGSSVLGACEAARKDGLIKSYYWCKSLQEILHALGYLGTVDMGCDWYTDMMHTDVNGYVHVTGGVAGGHSIQIGAVDMQKQAVRLDNSWGPDWGVKGSAWLSFKDLDLLRQNRGEFAVIRKFKP